MLVSLLELALPSDIRCHLTCLCKVILVNACSGSWFFAHMKYLLSKETMLLVLSLSIVPFFRRMFPQNRLQLPLKVLQMVANHVMKQFSGQMIILLTVLSLLSTGVRFQYLWTLIKKLMTAPLPKSILLGNLQKGLHSLGSKFLIDIILHLVIFWMMENGVPSLERYNASLPVSFFALIFSSFKFEILTWLELYY